MAIVGKIISLVAIVLYRNEWRKLERILHDLFSQEHVAPEIAQHILILAEDHRFFQHHGVDIISICRAIWRRATTGAIEGGSTLEQQLVRILTGRYERTLQRKVREVCLASLVTKAIPKSEIPSLYLSVAYFGWRMNGFLQVCRLLGLNHRQLSVQQAADVVARLKYPQSRLLSQRRADSIQRRKIHLVSLYYGRYPAEVESSAVLKPTHGTF